jgi:hypothetical protein
MVGKRSMLLGGGGDVVQWQSACLTGARPCIQCQCYKKTNKNNKVKDREVKEKCYKRSQKSSHSRLLT